MSVVVIGGANMDLHARSTEPMVLGSSNPGTATLSPGGVGRNIAETIARLGTPVALVAIVGDDSLGDEVLAWTELAGVDCSQVRRRPMRTGTYNALLGADGELVAAVADMAATDEINPLVLEAAREVIEGADLLVLDGNLLTATVDHALDLAAGIGLQVALDPVSVPKARRMVAALRPDRPVRLITPNLDELSALTGLPVGSDEEAAVAVGALHELGAETVWLRRGARGSVVSDQRGLVELPAYQTTVRDVTGAGDAAMGAFCHALVGGADLHDAVRYGQAAAALTVASDATVRPDLSDELIRRTQQ
jgi:pseudouridine kinase